MKNVLLIPDSFKGTMTSTEICDIMEKAIKIYFPEANIKKIPVADGGEGTVDAFLQATGGIKKYVTVKGPHFEDVNAFYGSIDNGKTAVIEMAACSGLPLAENKKNPLITTTYGVGQLMAEAIKNGATNLIVGLGGSATNDGGAGAAAALCIKFYNKNGDCFIPVGQTLKDIADIDISSLSPLLKNVKITAMCDINNPLYGPNGAAHIFAPQKGADMQAVTELDNGLRHLSKTVKRIFGIDLHNTPGAGAAGGMGYGMQVFFNASVQMGIETILDTVNFDSLLKEAEYVFSGEGKLDTQSLCGKVVIGVAKRAKAANVPLIAVVGDIGDNINSVYDMGVSAVFSINRLAVDFKKAKLRSRSDLFLTMENIARFIKLIEK